MVESPASKRWIGQSTSDVTVENVTDIYNTQIGVLGMINGKPSAGRFAKKLKNLKFLLIEEIVMFFTHFNKILIIETKEWQQCEK